MIEELLGYEEGEKGTDSGGKYAPEETSDAKTTEESQGEEGTGERELDRRGGRIFLILF
jgi:hypothetical protein